MRVAEGWQPGQPLRENDLSRFNSKVKDVETGCRQWLGALDRGYGRFWCAGKTLIAHRVAWEHVHGPVPKDLQLDHLCRNRGCVNPAHLEPVTLGTNVLRGTGITAKNLRKTHCVLGHPYNDRNTYRTKRGNRHCRTCAVARTAAWRLRQAS